MPSAIVTADNSDYIKKLSELNLPNSKNRWKVIDLFAGCGGLSLGFESAGFDVTGYEMNPKYVETYNRNLNGKCVQKKITEDVDLEGDIDVVIGGPPCQPYSETGAGFAKGKNKKKSFKGSKDERDGFPAFISYVRKLKPKIFIAENVRGLTFERNKKYLDSVIKQFKKLGYTVEYSIIKMSNYEVPQNRERLFIIGHNGSFQLPEPSKISFTVRNALGNFASETPLDGRYLSASEDEYILRYEKKCQLKNPRDLHLDKPSRTLTCRNLAGSTGDMIRLKMEDGRRRKIRVKEASRIQGFPDWFKFNEKTSTAFNEIGQSVPPIFAKKLAGSVFDYLENYHQAV
ncbi:DNA (cytosine-5-)-methyltransferase [Candidatus Poseidoniaceae archaeon]|nr:DNA (cytosine-5-)-methyltransferase [Candidatus Poseidoniaceae archaeon]